MPPPNTLAGDVEFAQTHVTRLNEEETRTAPLPIAERRALLLFTPKNVDTPDTASYEVSGSYIDKKSNERMELGAIALDPPAAIPMPMEQLWSNVKLEPYSDSAWTAMLPWFWMRPGVQLQVRREVPMGGATEDGLMTFAISKFGAPHNFDITWGEAHVWLPKDFPGYDWEPGGRMAQDYLSVFPMAEITYGFYQPLFLDYFVLGDTSTVPPTLRRFNSFTEWHNALPLIETTDNNNKVVLVRPTRLWEFARLVPIMRQYANMGIGLHASSGGYRFRYAYFRQNPAGFDSIGVSGFSHGTQGLHGFVNDEDRIRAVSTDTLPYRSLNDFHPVSYNGIFMQIIDYKEDRDRDDRSVDCSSTVSHEVGHTMGLFHLCDLGKEPDGDSCYVPAAAEATFPAGGNWQGPEVHPGPFDSTRGRFRTWYRVKAEGRVEGSTHPGKPDPMNVTSDPDMQDEQENPLEQYNADAREDMADINCFPPFLPGNTRRAQDVMQFLDRSFVTDYREYVTDCVNYPTVDDFTRPTFLMRDGRPGAYFWNAEMQDYQPYPHFLLRDGRLGAYTWNPETEDYEPYAHPNPPEPPVTEDELCSTAEEDVALSLHWNPITKHQVPVVTVWGTISELTTPDNKDLTHLYPPSSGALGNVFHLPTPRDEGLSRHIFGPRYGANNMIRASEHYLMVEYESASTPDMYALIASRNELQDRDNEGLPFSINLDASLKPTKVHLYRANIPYAPEGPRIDYSKGTLVDTITIDTIHPAKVWRVGREVVSAWPGLLEELCQSDCLNAQWPLLFEPRQGQVYVVGLAESVAATGKKMGMDTGTVIDLSGGGTPGSRIAIPVTDENDNSATVVARAVRVVTDTDGMEHIYEQNDPHSLAKHDYNRAQRWHVWLPQGENASLQPGRWRGRVELQVRLAVSETEDRALNPLDLRVDLTIPAPMPP